MKKTVTIILIITLILVLAGCKKTNNTYSESDLSSASVISSTEENTVSSEDNGSDISVSSLEESKTNSSTAITETPSSNVNSKVNSSEITVSTNNSNSSQTTIENKPTTYFEENHLQLSPHNTNFCFNTAANHSCEIAKKITFSTGNITEHPLYNDDCVPKEDISVSDYKYVTFETFGYLDDCQYSSVSYVFDKYTGIVLSPWKWTEISYNGDTQKVISVLDGLGGGFTEQSVFCPKNYDGLVFVVISENHKEIPDDDKTHIIDELIDFKNDKYYLFAMNN